MFVLTFSFFAQTILNSMHKFQPRVYLVKRREGETGPVQDIEKENAEPAWNIVEWLRSLNYEEAFQEFFEKAAKDAGLSPLALAKRYADAGKEPELSSLLNVAIPDVCRRTIKGAKETLRASAVTGAELNSKFAETGTFTLSFAELPQNQFPQNMVHHTYRL